MQTRTLGTTGPAVSALGLGAMGMSGAYGEADRAESIATVHAGLEAGVTLIDTGDFYAMGHNELLIAESLRGLGPGQLPVERQVRHAARAGPGVRRDGRPSRGGEELPGLLALAWAPTTSTSTALPGWTRPYRSRRRWARSRR
ncbi:hypothetical protein SAFG77S_04637 [Streptomyces afghaniensis]